MAFQSKNFTKFTATAATAVLVATAVAPAASAATFKDVSETSRYKEATDFLVTKGVKGFQDGTFGVNQNITRADAAVMLVNVLELDIESAPSAGFTDVNLRVEKHINALYEAGITNGAGNNKFNSAAQITRGELAIWIQRAFELTAVKTDVAFTDVSDRYKESVAALVENKVTIGKTATTFGTTASATRGEYALFLQRAFLIEDQTPLEAAIKEAEQAIASIPALEDFTLEDWDLIDDLLLKIEKVTELGGAEEDIANINVLLDLLYAIFGEVEILEDFTDVAVDLKSGEVTLTFTDAEGFEDYSFLASVKETSASGTVAEALTGENHDELVITFKPADLTETSIVEVEVSYLDFHYATYAVSNENDIWTVKSID